MRFPAGFLVSTLAVVLGAAPPPARSGMVTVSAAASLTDALEEIAKTYEASAGDKVAFNFGASSTLARQIEEGAPVDVFISADEANVDRLDGKKLLLAGTRRSILSNALVVVVEKDSPLEIGGPEALASSRVRTIALAEPRSVPAGVYAREYLERVGIWQKLRSKVVPTENVRAALAAVESGNADAAIVYRTDAQISSRVQVAYEVPAASAPAISYGAAVVAGSRDPGAARRFLDYLAGAVASAVFGKYGFSTVSPRP
ncbi:MAG TPA: molybdate ABC transporter substrate-binding protein [Thermoanaerobaculia bacterium]|nr:molybdate ABC transporter substrate-binding protein [Thermoanaerobaculia bacterium]